MLIKTAVPRMCLRSVLLFLVVCGCSCRSAFAKSPYSLSGTISTSRDRPSFTFSFKNKSEKPVSKVEFILSLYNSDGEPVFDTDWITVELPLFTEAGCVTEDFFSLEDYADSETIQSAATDYFYASKIYYSDGTVFQDPFGRYAE